MAESEEEKAWQDTIRKMLPAGAPLPDEDHLDYSIAVEYDGPPVPYDVPRVDPLDLRSLSLQSPSLASASVSGSSSSYPIVAPINTASRFNRHRINGFATPPPPPQPEDQHSARSSSQFESQHDSEMVTAQGRRPAVVRFNTNPNTRDSETGEEGFSSSPHSSAVESPRAEEEKGGSGRRGPCSRCGKGNRLKEREVCIVCGAKYCRNCLLKAMGSMPEGRKCVGCIGRPINESRRSSLDKSSRILRRLCGPLEVKQIMKAEKECSANQLRPEQLIVNGRQLRPEELAEILACPIPPQKLKPGRYWYDKDSGLWGKFTLLRILDFRRVRSQIG